jgi:hypothetical protein
MRSEVIIIDIQHEKRFLYSLQQSLPKTNPKKKKTGKINWLFVPVDCNKNRRKRQLAKKSLRNEH